MLLEYECLGGEYGRLMGGIWVLVEPIEVLIHCILPVVASIDSIRIETRYDFKDIILP